MNNLAIIRTMSFRSGALFNRLAPSSIYCNRKNEHFNLIANNNKRFISSSMPLMSSDHGSHSNLWKIERVLSGGLLAIIPASFLLPLPGLDYALALALITHTHWGVEAIVIDYIRPSIFGNTWPKVAVASVWLLSALALGGLFYFNYTDMGMANAMRLAWKRL